MLLLVSGILAVNNDPQPSLLSATLDVSDGEIGICDVLVTARRRKSAEVDVVEGVAQPDLASSS